VDRQQGKQGQAGQRQAAATEKQSRVHVPAMKRKGRRRVNHG
jgi:hypothetical protein